MYFITRSGEIIYLRKMERLAVKLKNKRKRKKRK